MKSIIAITAFLFASTLAQADPLSVTCYGMEDIDCARSIQDLPTNTFAEAYPFKKFEVVSLAEDFDNGIYVVSVGIAKKTGTNEAHVPARRWRVALLDQDRAKDNRIKNLTEIYRQAFQGMMDACNTRSNCDLYIDPNS